MIKISTKIKSHICNDVLSLLSNSLVRLSFVINDHIVMEMSQHNNDRKVHSLRSSKDNGKPKMKKIRYIVQNKIDISNSRQLQRVETSVYTCFVSMLHLHFVFYIMVPEHDHIIYGISVWIRRQSNKFWKQVKSLRLKKFYTPESTGM